MKKLLIIILCITLILSFAACNGGGDNPNDNLADTPAPSISTVPPSSSSQGSTANPTTSSPSQTQQEDSASGSDFKVSDNPNEQQQAQTPPPTTPVQPAGYAQVFLDKEAYNVNDLIFVSTTNALGMSIGIYQSWAAHDSPLQTQIPTSNNCTLNFNALSTGGSYEIRLYFINSNSEHSVDTFASSRPFVVIDPNAPPPPPPDYSNVTMTINKSRYGGNEKMQVTINNLPEVSDIRWVLIYLPAESRYAFGDKNLSRLGSNPTFEIDVPLFNGFYEIHLLVSNNSESDFFNIKNAVIKIPFSVDSIEPMPAYVDPDAGVMGPSN